MTYSSNPQGRAANRLAVTPECGYFVFSVDTELAWGDLWNQPHLEQTSRDPSAERAGIRRLLDLMDEFGVVATWAITGHLFYEACEECAVCPIMMLKGQDRRFDRIWQTRDAMWYGADVVDALRARGAGHEIGFHGYTHRTFDRLSDDESRFEIQEWIRLATRKGIVAETVIFPQGRIGHLELFKQAGFRCYRGAEVRHPALAIPVLGKILNRINLKLGILTPQVFEAAVDTLGLVNVPGSLWLFRTNRRVERLLDVLNLHTLRLRAAARSVRRAAEERKVIHFWLHPHELRTDKDFHKVRFVFESFAEQARAGKMRSITMADLATQTLRRHIPSTSGRATSAQATAPPRDPLGRPVP